jgi:hypothetical protein
MGERRVNWMAVIQEFDLDIKPAKLVKGQGLCKLAAKAQYQINEDSWWENESTLWCIEDLYVPSTKESWYRKLIYLLHHKNFPKDLSPK